MALTQFPIALFPDVNWFLQVAEEKNSRVTTSCWFEKQSAFSRYAIAGPNKVQVLSVPVVHTGEKKWLRDTRIAYAEKWQKDHINAIRSAYGKAPFFEFYDYRILPVIEKNHVFLADLLEAGLQVLFFALLPERDLVFDTGTPREVLQGKVPAYPQVFDDRFGFRPGMSALDLLFNLGPEAEFYLSQGRI